ncbi:hypothetical protein AMTR_s00221p00026280 [Amborella trichopoda]|uniref:DUF834 domain-containing protein n=1 Tax=Amborella trichopoda TaxID=13333 RepID=W1NP73_AMBTC|nr:hypothetical protein AMTR_s00221p00026280 [Amborella trichopoda]
MGDGDGRVMDCGRERETPETKAAEVEKEANTVGCRSGARRNERDRLKERTTRWIAAGGSCRDDGSVAGDDWGLQQVGAAEMMGV